MAFMNMDDFRGMGFIESLIGVIPAALEAGAVGFSTYSTSKTKDQEIEQRRREFAATMEQRQRELAAEQRQREQAAFRKTGETTQIAIGAAVLLGISALVIFGLRRA